MEKTDTKILLEIDTLILPSPDKKPVYFVAKNFLIIQRRMAGQHVAQNAKTSEDKKKTPKT